MNYMDPTKIPGFLPANMAGSPGHAAPSAGPGGVPRPGIPPRGNPIIFPWWYLEMPGSADFEANALNFTAAANATTAVPAFEVEVNSGNVGVCAFIQFTVQNPTATTFIRAAFFVNDGPVQGWGNLYIPPLSATAFVQPFNGVVIRMPENSRLTAKVINDTASAFTCSLQVRGWTTPLSVVQQFMNGVNY